MLEVTAICSRESSNSYGVVPYILDATSIFCPYLQLSQCHFSWKMYKEVFWSLTWRQDHDGMWIPCKFFIWYGQHFFRRFLLIHPCYSLKSSLAQIFTCSNSADAASPVIAIEFVCISNTFNLPSNDNTYLTIIYRVRFVLK